jgi:hypothetical protein
MNIITIHNAETGEIIEREMNDKELAQLKAAQVEAEKFLTDQAETEVKRQTALAKLAALGLEEDDLKALGL